MRTVILLVFILILLTVVFFSAKLRLFDIINRDIPFVHTGLTGRIAINSFEMKITSPVFKNLQNIPPKYTCSGEDVNPPLDFSGVPHGTLSLVLIVDDPDAPGGTWVHWTVFNISPSEESITENSKPLSGSEGKTSWGKSGYGGPCPPSGTHRYFFKLYALDTKLKLSSFADNMQIESAMQGHILAEAKLIGLYKK